MKRIPSVTWEYGDKTRRIVAVKALEAYLRGDLIQSEFLEIVEAAKDGTEPESPAHIERRLAAQAEPAE